MATHNGEAHDKSPHASPRLLLESSPESDIMLEVLCFNSIAHKFLVVKEFGVLNVDRLDSILGLFLELHDG